MSADLSNVQISLYNTKTRIKAPFAPIDPANVRMYVCGPTVYDRAHVGNARPVVVFDTLFRLLRHVYGADHVTYARNFTDVDDKINAKAAATGRSIGDITAETIGWYHADMDALGALRPSHEPRATDYIRHMIAMIERLIAAGAAYEAEGHVLFHTPADPAYGSLSGRSIEDMTAGARVEVAPYKRDPMDFVLWKPSTPDLPGWDSPWGVGRPGWHIECSAMARDLLGGDFDIHGGGIDLAFPHHENECAQSRCAHPDEGFARVWMHNGFLMVNGEKMSKSLGNFFTVRDLLGLGIPGEVIRFGLLSTHYCKPFDWTEALAAEARCTLLKWRALTKDVEPSAPAPGVLAALADNLNTPLAIAELHKLAGSGDMAALKASAGVMGLLTDELGGWDINFNELFTKLGAETRYISQIIKLNSIPLPKLNPIALPKLSPIPLPKINPIQFPKLNLDYMNSINKSIEMVNEIKSKFQNKESASGILGDAPLKEVYNMKKKINDLIEKRTLAKKARDFAQADAIRAALINAGVEVKDTPQGAEWTLTDAFDPDKLPMS